MKKILTIILLLSSFLFADKLHIEFDSDSYEIKKDQLVKLDKFIDFLFTNPDLSTMLEGYADSIDTYEYNLALSKKRVEAVRAYILNEGIIDCRVKTMAYGEKNPKVSNELKNGRQINRRVIAKIIERR